MPGIFNCDWFSFTADFEGYNAAVSEEIKSEYLNPEVNKHLGKVFKLLDVEKEKNGNGYIDFGLWKFEVYPHGSRRYYYILHNDDLEIQLARYRGDQADNYPVYVHFKSQFLWSSLYGVSSLDEKFRLVIEWLEQLLNAKYTASKINRIDLAYHCDDLPFGFSADCFVGRHTLDTTRRTHRLVSGVDVGSRKSDKIFLRCYNKYLECRSTKKVWFFPIWMAHGLDIRKVWNIEFQMKREFFRETQIAGRIYDTCEQVIAAQQTIWLYLTTDWVSYRIPDNERRTRWSIHPWWQSLYSFVETEDRINRSVQRELPTEDAIIPGLRGYLTSYAARTGHSLQDGTLFRKLLQALSDYDEKNAKDFDRTSLLKQSLIDPEGWQQYAVADAPQIAPAPAPAPAPEPNPEQISEAARETIEQLMLALDSPADYTRLLDRLNDLTNKKSVPREDAKERPTN